MWRSALVWLVVACDADVPPTPAPKPEPVVEVVPVAPVKPPQPAHGTMRATWSKIVTVDDCWYFSGPDGRDTRLAGTVEITRDGDRLTLAFGRATFTGTAVNGELALARTTSGDFGDTWTVKETIRGKYLEGSVRAHYAYTECEAGTPCPNKCTISAELVLAR